MKKFLVIALSLGLVLTGISPALAEDVTTTTETTQSLAPEVNKPAPETQSLTDFGHGNFDCSKDSNGEYKDGRCNFDCRKDENNNFMDDRCNYDCTRDEHGDYHDSRCNNKAEVDTSLNRNTEGGGSGGLAPIVQAKWEMNNNKDSHGKYIGSDDSKYAGAQFLPSGQYNVNKPVTVCAVVTDPAGVNYLENVYADIFYPQNVYTGIKHDPSRQGCGKVVGTEFTLSKLSKTDGIDLLCDKIKNHNYNLPTFGDANTYDKLCKADGDLMKETSSVYCGTGTLSYEDPSGDYTVTVLAQDRNGVDGTLSNTFKYLPCTSFETDFHSINYGDVRLNAHKIINGDLTFAQNDGKATVRNTGNTRLKMKVLQDDMGLGKTDNNWNVKYDARVGSNASFANYYPMQWAYLNDPLDLSETNEMDFSIQISKFPPNHSGNGYQGHMTLAAMQVDHLTCSNPCGDGHTFNATSNSCQ